MSVGMARDFGGNFSFLVAYGGRDEYGCGAKNNSYNQRGGERGFLIDRPKREEIESPSDAPPISETPNAE